MKINNKDIIKLYLNWKTKDVFWDLETFVERPTKGRATIKRAASTESNRCLRVICSEGIHPTKYNLNELNENRGVATGWGKRLRWKQLKLFLLHLFPLLLSFLFIYWNEVNGVLNEKNKKEEKIPSFHFV